MNLFEKYQNRILKIVLPIIFIGPFLLFFLTSCEPMNSSEIINALLPNVWVFISHLFAAVILLIIIVWLVWKPTKTSLQKRHDYIANEINEAQKANAQSAIALQEANQSKIDAYNQANEIIESAQKQSFEIKEKTKIEAKQIASKIKNDAMIEIEQSKNALDTDINSKIVDLAFSTAEAILNKEISQKDDEKFIDQLLSELEKDHLK